ncbi:tetratricopeptide repeat protein [Streptomyces sp. HUAS TT3]|uniref:tetratricopeptide repeat protein n=1 Tax=Streptomyces sp. HUAS TT3 TaxID=3447510 RepID=UPI003F65BDC9
MTDSWRRFRSDLRALKDASGMNFREIQNAAGESCALPTSTVHGLLADGERRCGRECTGQLEMLVSILLRHAPRDAPAVTPWRDRASWQARWESLDDRGRSDVPDAAMGGTFGWDDPLEKAGMGADTESAWLTVPRLSRIAAVVGELAALGLYRQAHDTARELLRCAEGTLRPHDPGMLAARHVAAYWTGEAGELHKAREMTAALSADCLRLRGALHPLTRLAALRLAAWTTGAGDPAQGRRLYRELAGSGPADRITLLARLGAIRAGFLGGDTEDALDRLEDLLPGLTAEYGLQHAVVLAARVQQIRGRRRAGKRRPCTLDALEGLVHEAIEHLGPAHPLTLYVRGRHARSVDNHGDSAGARELAEETYLEAVRVLGPDHPDTLTAGGDVAVVLARFDRAAAEAMFRHLYGRCRQVLGPDHYRTLGIAHNLGVVLHHGDPRTARPLYEEVREVRTRVLGPDHPDTLLTGFALAHTVLLLDGEAAARPLFEEVYCARVRVLGPQHRATRRVLGFLGEAGSPAPELPRGAP